MTGDDVREEIRAHLAQRVRDNLARGMSMEDATREAESRFGSVARVEADCARVDRRRQSPWRGWRQDTAAAFLGLRRAPVTTTLGIVIVAAGLSVTLAVAMLADALLFSAPAGVRDAGRLRIVMNSFDGERPSFMTYETCLAMIDAASDAQAFCRGNDRTQVVAGGVAGVRGTEFVTANYFGSLGTRLAAGRFLTGEDEQSRAPVALVSTRLAEAAFESTIDAAGRTLTINGQTVTVVGVLERGFQGQMSADPADVWVPIAIEPMLSVPNVLPDGSTVRGRVEARMGWLMGVVRLPAGQSAEALQARLTPVVRGDKPLRDTQRALLFDRAWLTPFAGDRERLMNVMAPLGAAVGLTLLLSAACLSSLFVGRVISRRLELTVRETLGASRGRIARLVAVECLVAIAAGALVAAPVAVALLAAIGRLHLTTGIRVEDVAFSFDWRAALLVAVAASIVAVIAIPGPLLLLRRLTARGIHGARLTGGGVATRRVLMAAQVAVGCALLAGAVLLTRTITALERQPLGFDARGLAFLDLEPSKSGLTADEQASLLRRLQDDAMADRTMAVAEYAPFGGDIWKIVVAEGSARTQPLTTPAVRVLGSYFETLGIPILAGESLADRRLGERVMVISQSLAETFWPGQPALGRTIRMGGPKGIAYQVIGIADAVRDLSLRTSIGRLYFPLDDDLETLTIMRRSPQPGVAAGILVQEFRERDPRLIPVRSGVVSDLVRRSLDQRVMFRLVTTIVGAGSLVIVAVGVWGLAHSTVARRWREFGVRLALGAQRRDVRRLAMRDAFVVFITGAGAGLLLAWQFGRALESWLFGVTAWDPVALAVATALVGVAVFAGNSLPARKAGRLEPAQLLRSE